MSTQIENPLQRLSEEQIEELGREFQQIHDDVYADLGEHDAHYIRSMVMLQRRLAVLSRIVLIASRFPGAWLAGTAGLSLAKILENMEIGHNVMHGQWDWMNDPYIHSSVWDWDTASTAASWKHSHNYVHHTYTNIIGKDKDVGYEIMRVDPKQPWHPVYVLQPFYNVLLAAFFEWGVALHDLDLEAIRKREKDIDALRDDLKGMSVKMRRQVVKDYIAWPLISALAMTGIEAAVITAFRRPSEEKGAKSALRRLVERRSFREPFKRTLTANLTANFVRNFWSYAIIFCGHFPDQTYTFTEEEAENETRGGWYVRQLLGAANIDGGPFFHALSGNLSYQVEHHLYPDMPSSRYQQIAPRVREICERYDLPYNTGPFGKQFGSVQRTILRLAFPGGEPRPKPGPWREPETSSNGASPEGKIPAFP